MNAPPVKFVSSGDGARASARFNVRPDTVRENAGPFSFCELKRRERRAPPWQVISGGIGRVNEHLKKMGAVWN